MATIYASPCALTKAEDHACMKGPKKERHFHGRMKVNTGEERYAGRP